MLTDETPNSYRTLSAGGPFQRTPNTSLCLSPGGEGSVSRLWQTGGIAVARRTQCTIPEPESRQKGIPPGRWKLSGHEGVLRTTQLSTSRERIIPSPSSSAWPQIPGTRATISSAPLRIGTSDTGLPEGFRTVSTRCDAASVSPLGWPRRSTSRSHRRGHSPPSRRACTRRVLFLDPFGQHGRLLCCCPPGSDSGRLRSIPRA